MTKFDLDFGFEMVLETMDETFQNFKGFKRILTNLPEIQNDDTDYIATCLNDAYAGKEIKISYSEKQGKSEIPIIQDLFLNTIEDSIKQILLSILP